MVTLAITFATNPAEEKQVSKDAISTKLILTTYLINSWQLILVKLRERLIFGR